MEREAGNEKKAGKDKEESFDPFRLVILLGAVFNDLD